MGTYQRPMSFIEILMKKAPEVAEAIEKVNIHHDERGRFSSVDGAKIISVPKSYTDKVLAKYAAKEPEITKHVSHAVASTGAEMSGLDYRLKSEGSLHRKVKDEMHEELEGGSKTTLKEYMGKLSDVVRYTALSDEANLVSTYNKVIGELQAKGYEHVKTRNYWNNPKNPYNGLNTNFKTPDGTRIELQFHTKASLETKEAQHKPYEEYRAKGTTPERRAELNTEMFDMANKLTRPHGIDDVIDHN